MTEKWHGGEGAELPERVNLFLERVQIHCVVVAGGEPYLVVRLLCDNKHPVCGQPLSAN